MTKIIAGYNPTGDTLWRALYDRGEQKIIGHGCTRQAALDDLNEKSDLLNVPTDISDAFQLDMAEKGIHHDNWCDTFSDWLEANVEVMP